MIRAHKATHSIGSMPYPTLITQIPQATKVPFKVAPKGCKDGRVIGHDTLKKIGLVDNSVGSSSLTLGHSCSRSTLVKSTVMGLLHKLVRKIFKVLKNQRTLASNQK